MAENLRDRLGGALAARLSPEHTRKATLTERLTVQRLSWDHIVRLHRYLEFAGKLATAVWCGFVGSVILGVSWKDVVEQALNSGEPLERVTILVLAFPTFVFLAARSVLGYLRWRLQRELWRRDVARLTGASGLPAGAAGTQRGSSEVS